jgi:hypothetical protein
MDEACGEAALRVDPDRPEAIAKGIRRALAEREALAAAGLAHAAQFSWLDTGRAILQGYAEALS